jgi:site-specific DNA-cytosine methylase
MNILVAYESSGTVREAFRKAGHNAWSCDLQPADDGSTYHFQGDVEEWISDPALKRWDLIIMHPPCTALCVSGNAHYGTGKPKHQQRIDAIEYTLRMFELAKANADAVCMENPVGVLPIKASQYIQPWQFGHGECKKTGLWLHNLPKLKPTNIVEGREQRIWKLGPSPDRWKIRSKTYAGIAQAMAEQF